MIEPKLTETNMTENELKSLLTKLKGVDVEKLVAMVSAVPSAVVADEGPTLVDKNVLDDGCSASSKSGLSWADEVESETSSVTGVPVASDKVRSTVGFGAFEPVKMKESDGRLAQTGLMSQHVKIPAARGLRSTLAKYGVKMPRAADWHLAMATYTAATMPDFFTRGKDKLRTFAVLGDSALVSAVAAEAVEVGQGLDSVQKLRTTLLTDAAMCRAFADSEFAAFVSVAAGVDLRHSKTGATALEAIIGLVAYYRSSADVRKLARVFSLVKF